MTLATLRRGVLLCCLALYLGPGSTFGVDATTPSPIQATLTLPRKDGSVRFAVIGDMGVGSPAQYDVGTQMTAFHREFPFDFVIMLGDNIYGADTPADMRKKFELPYKELLDAGVQFRASLGNHDNPNQRLYKPFNMGGERYYTFQPFKGTGGGEGAVRFFAIDSTYLAKEQLDWLERELAASHSDWKIAFFHHPLYSSGRTHGPSLEARAILEPLFVKYGVSAVFSGHEHFYERLKPQKGIAYWISGAAGQLRKGNILTTDLTAKGFDADQHFMLVEISGDELYFQAVSRRGATVDSGVLRRPGAPPVGAEATPAPKPSPVPVSVPAVPPNAGSTTEGAPTGAPSPATSPTPKP